ncbi:DUF3712 domain containing protein [Pyrenophora tritici-repentis]|nr:DUF3712 domain containing protein [Pyrenophora tritici-repentis]
MSDKAAPHTAEDVYTTPQKRGGVVNKLYPPGPQPGAKGRMKNHCRKFWWCGTLLGARNHHLDYHIADYLCCHTKKAQSEINASTLEVTSQEVTSPTSDSIHLKIDTVIRSDSSYHPEIDAFRAGLSLEGQEPFLYLNVPKAKSEKETRITIDQDVKLASLAAFSNYTKTVLGSESFDLRLDGKTNIHLSGLPTMDVNYNKIITMKGLNRLAGLNITDVRILSGANEILPDGSNLVEPPPQAGDNKFPIQSHVDQLTILGLITSKYKNAILPLEIVGNSSVKNGQHLTYYEDAIKSNTVKLNLDVGPALAGIGINTTSFGS